jgi:argininosuccinate lyase
VVSNPRSAVRVADAFSTGSSMMPNKRNPDPALSAAGPRG